jgi:transposase-like protein
MPYSCLLQKEETMVLIAVRCPHCHSDQVIKGGKTKTGQQRYKCQNADCPHYSFQRTLIYKGRSPEIKEQVVDMSLNGSGIRDTARVLKISPTTVINELKKKKLCSFLSTNLCSTP